MLERIAKEYLRRRGWQTLPSAWVGMAVAGNAVAQCVERDDNGSRWDVRLMPGARIIAQAGSVIMEHK